jgi:hypothetical protein
LPRGAAGELEAVVAEAEVLAASESLPAENAWQALET